MHRSSTPISGGVLEGDGIFSSPFSILYCYHMPFNNSASLIHPKRRRSRPIRCPAVPPSRMMCTRFLSPHQCALSIRMGDSYTGLLRFLRWPAREQRRAGVTRRPDIIWNLRYRWGKKNGLMWIHEPKGNTCLCQSVAKSTVHGHRA